MDAFFPALEFASRYDRGSKAAIEYCTNLWGRYGEGGATSEGRGSPLRNCWVLSFSAFALTDLKRFLKLRLWLANEEPPLVPFLVNIGARSSVGVDGVEAPEALLRLLSCCIKVLVVEADRTLAEEVVPILQGRRRKRAVSPLGPFEGGEKATLVVDVGVVADEDDAAPLDNEKYEGLSVNIRAQSHRVSSLNSRPRPVQDALVASSLNVLARAQTHRSVRLDTFDSALP